MNNSTHTKFTTRDIYPRDIGKLPRNSLQEIISQTQLAFMIYTSGSIGWPKATVNEHLAIVNRLIWPQDYYHLSPLVSLYRNS